MDAFDLKTYGYHLPEELIAQEPVFPRDKARLMVIDRVKQTISHDTFNQLDKYLPPKSVLVLNDSKVVPARLLGRREDTGGEVEIFLLKRLSDGYTYQTLLRPLKRLKQGEKISFGKGELVAEIVDKENRLVRLNKKNISSSLEKFGHMPLPPYIKRSDGAMDRKYYQTVYAKKDGSVASPTAGLHFTTRLLEKISRAGHDIHKVTLHINYATFKPVEESDIRNHPIHSEDYEVAKGTVKAIQKAKAEGKKIVSVGTTATRVLETVGTTGSLKGRTNIFIYPGYQFKMMDVLITNFHLPFSTLLMLVYAFGTRDLMSRAYQEAVKEKYRFFSYGDGMMIL
ncbi:MAG: tRNA preQ1(34) S-adenosylmethionine ribosyltransferase-isomerase QueA [Candidatus Omnitrophica bacterium]|nr:tRNA preQ1(34) S-adenosylmethionine ribosyltransferase-isomerase QueA [Candidatus Omnitrophota bacterium]